MKVILTTSSLLGLSMVFCTCDSIKYCDAYSVNEEKDCCVDTCSIHNNTIDTCLVHSDTCTMDNIILPQTK